MRGHGGREEARQPCSNLMRDTLGATVGCMVTPHTTQPRPGTRGGDFIWNKGLCRYT